MLQPPWSPIGHCPTWQLPCILIGHCPNGEVTLEFFRLGPFPGAVSVLGAVDRCSKKGILSWQKAFINTVEARNSLPSVEWEQINMWPVSPDWGKGAKLRLDNRGHSSSGWGCGDWLICGPSKVTITGSGRRVGWMEWAAHSTCLGPGYLEDPGSPTAGDHLVEGGLRII